VLTCVFVFQYLVLFNQLSTSQLKQANMPRDHSQLHTPSMDKIVEDDVEELSPVQVVIEHPAIMINDRSVSRGNTKAKLGFSTAEDIEGATRTSSTPSRLVVGKAWGCLKYCATPFILRCAPSSA
jgi:hypothetical protein